jgi:LPXTG-motif cell wall-anchored protein
MELNVIKSLARRVALGALAAVAAVGVSTLFATAASAHTAGVTGVAHCDDANGVWTITWTVSNDYSTKGEIKSLVLNPTDAKAKVPTSVDPKSSVTFSSTAAGKSTSASLNLVMWWPDNYHVPGGATVPLNGPCVVKPPTESTPTPSPTPTKPVVVTPTPSASVPSLPVTGSNTTLPMVGAGAGLVAAGGVLLFVIRRRRQVTFTAE